MDIREHVVALNEKRARAWEEGKRLLEDTAGKEMTAEERQTWDRINADIVAIDAEVRQFVDIETREREAAALREASAHLFGEARVEQAQKREQNFLKDWLELGPGRSDLVVDVRTAAKERDLLRRGASPEEIRALAWDTGSVASAVPTTMSRTLYEYMEAGIAAFRVGATQFNTTAGENIDFPKVTAHAIATQVSGQGTTLAGTDPTFGKLTLGAYKYGELVKVAAEVVTDPGIDISSFLGRDIGRALARKIDADLVVGTGSGQPLGLMAGAMTGAAGTVSTGGTVTNVLLAVNGFIDAVYGINDEYRNRGAAWLIRDSTAGALRKVRDGGGGTIGAFLWEPSLTNGLQGGQPDRFLGYPVYTDPNVASLASNARIAAFGDFSTYYIRTVGNVRVESDASRYFDTDEIGFRGKWRVDGDYIEDTGVVLLKNSV